MDSKVSGVGKRRDERRTGRRSLAAMIRLAYGLVAGRDLGVWAPGPDGVTVDARRRAVPAGSAVILGPRTADAARSPRRWRA